MATKRDELTLEEVTEAFERAKECDTVVSIRTMPSTVGGCFVVACKDTGVDGVARYYLATRETFPYREEAEEYASTCSPSRDPIVIEGRFFQLRRGD
jgi:hypothetical protein